MNDDQMCQQGDMLLVVMTMNRPHSVKRLLNSLKTAEYSSYNSIDLRVTVDSDHACKVDEEIKRLLSPERNDLVPWPSRSNRVAFKAGALRTVAMINRSELGEILLQTLPFRMVLFNAHCTTF